MGLVLGTDPSKEGCSVTVPAWSAPSALALSSRIGSHFPSVKFGLLA